MVTIAIGLFLFAALFGLYMASRVFGGNLPPWGAVILHGLLAASGLVVVLYEIYGGARSMPLLAGAGLLVIAALGGFFMLTFQLRKAPPPKGWQRPRRRRPNQPPRRTPCRMTASAM